MARRPNKYQNIKIETSRFLPPRGYNAITFFGIILVRRNNNPKWKQYFETASGKILLNHEWIHVKQAVSTHNSWICFFHWKRGVLQLQWFIRSSLFGNKRPWKVFFRRVL